MQYWSWLKTGDEAAYREFAADFGRKYERWLIWNGFSQADAVDVAEDGTVEVLLRLDKFQPQDPVDEKFIAWAWKLARHFAEDWRRHRRPGLYEPLKDTLPDPAIATGSNPIEAEQQKNRDDETAAARIAFLRSRVEALSQIYRQVVLLKDFEGLTTFGEVARQLGIAENTARVRYHRALKLLRQIAITEPAL